MRSNAYIFSLGIGGDRRTPRVLTSPVRFSFSRRLSEASIDEAEGVALAVLVGICARGGGGERNGGGQAVREGSVETV